MNPSGGRNYASLLAAAARYNRLAEASVLLEHVADINDVRISSGRTDFSTCLQAAVISNHQDMVELWIKKAADINLVCPAR